MWSGSPSGYHVILLESNLIRSGEFGTVLKIALQRILERKLDIIEAPSPGVNRIHFGQDLVQRLSWQCFRPGSRRQAKNHPKFESHAFGVAQGGAHLAC
jgi:hypothetical protein